MLLLWMGVRLNSQVVLLIFDQLLQVVVSNVTILKSWSSKDFRVEHEQVFKYIQQRKGVSSINEIVDHVVVLIKELLNGSLAANLSHHLVFLLFDVIHIKSCLILNLFKNIIIINLRKTYRKSRLIRWEELNGLLVLGGGEFLNKSSALGLRNVSIAIQVILSEEFVKLSEVCFWLASLV